MNVRASWYLLLSCSNKFFKNNLPLRSFPFYSDKNVCRWWYILSRYLESNFGRRKSNVGRAVVQCHQNWESHFQLFNVWTYKYHTLGKEKDIVHVGYSFKKGVSLCRGNIMIMFFLFMIDTKEFSFVNASYCRRKTPPKLIGKV